MKIQDLQKDSQYTVQQDFTDFYHNQVARGERLTFVESHFLPYHGGHTIVFRERTLYLQEEQNSNILSSLGNYLQHATEAEN
jgi:hypothetical protein